MNLFRLLCLSLSVLIFTLIANPSNSPAQWVHASIGVAEGPILSFAAKGNILYAGTGNLNGLYISSNSGLSWSQTPLNHQWVYSLAVKGNSIFAGSGALNGLYLSTDNGVSWSILPLNEFIHSLAVNDNYVIAGTGNGVYLSSNNGAVWTQTSFTDRTIQTMAVNGNDIFAGSDGIYLSVNNGNSWAHTSLDNQLVYSIAVNGNALYCGVQSGGVYKSTDNGANWLQTSLNNIDAFSVAIEGENIFAATYWHGIYVSNNAGATWTQRNENLFSGAVREVYIFNSYIFAGTSDSGVYRRQLGELIGIKPISNEIPRKFVLYQNYPNPFNPTTKIKFDVPADLKQQTADVKLIIYDVLGRVVAELVNEKLNPGTYETEWDASQFASGIYFYQLTVSSEQLTVYAQTKKLVLIK